MESIELFGREVLPEIRDRDERMKARKAERIAKIADKALARREAVRRSGEHIIPSTRGPMRA